jgi:IS5 family transposase
MSNRFEQPKGFLDLAVEQGKKVRTFLDDVERLVDWRPVEKLLKKELKRNRDAVGNPAYPPLAMFKILLMQRWWNLSDQGMDDTLADRISFRRFAGLSFGYDTPDSTTICRFRNHLLQLGLDQKLFDLIGRQLEEHQLVVKQGVIVDATIVESSRRSRKTMVVEESEADDEDDPQYDVNTTYSDDVEAKWTIKAGKPYYGYKVHMATDAEHGFILGGHATPANRSDTKELMEVVAGARVVEGSMVFADKGYSSVDNRCSLQEADLTDGIMYKAARGRKLSEAEAIMNRAISRLRGKVERAFGTLKRDYRFQRARYLGCAKVQLEFMLNAMAFNLKKAALMVA